MRRKFKWLIIATSAIIISFGGIAALDNYKSIKADQEHIQHLEVEQKKLHDEREKLQQQNTETQQQLDQKQKTEEELRKEIEALKVAKAERERQRLALSSSVAAAEPSQAIAAGWHYDCRPQRAAVQQAVSELGLSGDWQYIDYIFDHESCHDPGRLNSGNCAGLGQACPGTKLPCGPADIKCQVKWFDGYARGKGGWAASYNFWLANKWW